MHYNTIKHAIQAIYSKYSDIESQVEAIKEEISKHYKFIQTFDRDAIDDILWQFSELAVTIAELPTQHKLALLVEVKEDLDKLVKQRQMLKKPITQQTPKVDGLYKSITRALETTSQTCESEILKEIKDNPDRFLNEDGKVRIVAKNFVIEEGPKKRKFTIADPSQVRKEFLMVNEDAVKEYYDTIGILPEGIAVETERHFTVSNKKTSPKE